MIAADEMEGTGKARLIDLEHPVKEQDKADGKDRLERYRADFLFGIEDLQRTVEASKVKEKEQERSMAILKEDFQPSEELEKVISSVNPELQSSSEKSSQPLQ